MKTTTTLRALPRLLLAPLLAPLLALSAHAADAWVPDLGNGSYRNPVLNADYSDPDAVRVGDTYYMTSSSFNSAPGLPLLQSKDLVNWRLVGHALPKQVPAAHFAAPRHGGGVWAPCLRHHDGKFWIFYPDPDHGVYVTTAANFSGPWSEPRLLLPGKGIIDPTPLWDDDGKAWLLHASARSRAGVNNILTLHAMAPDGSRLLDAKGKVIIDGDRLPGYRTLEGPKFYKHDGYYYVFAPAGGVEHGWQSVFRSRTIDGPYEDRIVMEQGDTPVNGPHQGAWVRAQDGKDWFLHFQDRKAYGRVVHLQPMAWQDGWPVIGRQGPKPGVGNPVDTHRKPVAGQAIAVPATSDEFDGKSLGLQWQWNANPQEGWHSLSARPGHLRLPVQAIPESKDFVRAAPNIVTQKLPATTFTAETKIELRDPRDGDRAGLILNGQSYAALGLRQRGADLQLVYTTCAPFRPRCAESETVLLQKAPAVLTLRMAMAEGANARFQYSTDGKRFADAGAPFAATKGHWVGAQMGLYSVSDAARPSGATLDVDYFRVTP
ncbi:family 43 glycosylhydrolase [Massilia dura]|uniref:Family 43 glycosylhydrolase n=1 Tax=Pseudoduganella dura TaxID=321982 RepID=A0A6I3XUK2_9BURK|nr:glycoside hydrolase 43 family protein [Pseudoduganella dura]MUI15405.1 family 43 glycosylhydrolase [Pseudoduganella dura]GGX80143.1 glycoside hydrolase [Pseudoduganella dura]